MEVVEELKAMPKHCKTAFQNIWRNGVMSISSIFAVTITLILIGVVSVIAINVNHMTVNIENSLNIYVKVDRAATDEQSKAVGDEINKLTGIKKVNYSSKDKELDKLIASQDKNSKQLFENYRNDNPLGDAYIVEVKNAKNLDKIAKKIGDIPCVKEVTYGGSSTNKLVDILESVRNGGAIFVVALIVVALFMIANTIKITITSRSTEISIMRMVGASNWYIRIPFMLEGIFIGLIGSIVPLLILVYGYKFAYVTMTSMMSSNLITFMSPYPLVWQLGALLALLGAVVGLIGSFFSVRKFLKL